MCWHQRCHFQPCRWNASDRYRDKQTEMSVTRCLRTRRQAPPVGILQQVSPCCSSKLLCSGTLGHERQQTPLGDSLFSTGEPLLPGRALMCISGWMLSDPSKHGWLIRQWAPGHRHLKGPHFPPQTGARHSGWLVKFCFSLAYYRVCFISDLFCILEKICVNILYLFAFILHVNG